MGWAIALHGGLTVIDCNLPDLVPRKATLRRSLDAGVSALRSGASALAAVEIVVTLGSPSSLLQVQELENCPYFSAGIGSVLTSHGTVEMDACIMDSNKNCGSVSGLSTVVNPVSLARLVMEKTPHIYLAFDGAEAFAREQGVETREASYFITEQNIERLRHEKEGNEVKIDYTTYTQENSGSSHVDHLTAPAQGDVQKGTVGCVAIDSSGYLATATSTGGLVNKMVGRIGDTPIIGSGTYANNLCAVSATGDGESIVRHTVARDVAALMEYKGLSIGEAAAQVVKKVPGGNVLGLIAVSANGEVTTIYNTPGMFRACASEDGYSMVGIWPADDGRI